MNWRGPPIPRDGDDETFVSVGAETTLARDEKKDFVVPTLLLVALGAALGWTVHSYVTDPDGKKFATDEEGEDGDAPESEGRVGDVTRDEASESDTHDESIDIDENTTYPLTASKRPMFHEQSDVQSVEWPFAGDRPIPRR